MAGVVSRFKKFKKKKNRQKQIKMVKSVKEHCIQVDVRKHKIPYFDGF